MKTSTISACWLSAAATFSNAISVPAPISNAIDRLRGQQTVATAERFLIELGPDERRWVTEDEKWQIRRSGRKFFDITSSISSAEDIFPRDEDGVAEQMVVKYPKKPAQNESIAPLLKKLDKENMRSNLETFSGFHTRYYKSEYGRRSSEWLLDQVNETLADAGAGIVAPFPHDWIQSSIIATLPGKSEKTIVIGAHQDSINLFLPPILAAPGADDDGSGTVTILEALRVLLTDKDIAQGKAENTIEFHWYSAEEGGLLGSQAIFSKYAKQGRDVRAMLQQDMTGYTKGTIDAGKPVSVGVVTDFVDPGLTDFIKKVIKDYCTIPYVETKCGYACSDHASANKNGFPSAFVIESEFKTSDPKVHTTEDTMDRLDFDHMLQHARMTLGLAYELAFAKFAD